MLTFIRRIIVIAVLLFIAYVVFALINPVGAKKLRYQINNMTVPDFISKRFEAIELSSFNKKEQTEKNQNVDEIKLPQPKGRTAIEQPAESKAELKEEQQEVNKGEQEEEDDQQQIEKTATNNTTTNNTVNEKVNEQEIEAKPLVEQKYEGKISLDENKKQAGFDRQQYAEKQEKADEAPAYKPTEYVAPKEAIPNELSAQDEAEILELINSLIQ